MPYPQIARVFRAAPRSEQDRVLDTLQLAFAADPVTRFWWANATEYLSTWRGFVLAKGERGFDHDAVTIAEGFEAASMWLPPGVDADEGKLAAWAAGLPPSTAEEDALLAEFQKEMARFHPEAPCWYLWMIGVDPARQGQGWGGALLRHGLDRCDREGQAAYLECSDPRNVPFYERYGFERLGVIEVDPIPPLTPMIRTPR